uniref:Thioredoxin reductase n=1 Tax=Dugesia japonica TaxID=6161 RepID=A0A068ASV4_DUGJA|nr:thioredoxin reductase [Dugesia japonica]
MKLGRYAIIITYSAVRSFSTGLKMNYNASNSAKIYDLVVIGGGSGGLACAKEAAIFGKEVAVLDYVVPTLKSTSWGLGGTCVNVGCIPKKLMHHISQMRDIIENAHEAGWKQVSVKPESLQIDWPTMATRVQNYVKSLNWGHRVALRENKIEYINAKAKFKDGETIVATDIKGGEKEIKAKNFVIAVGGRPKYPDIPGAKEFGITSDDLFWLKNTPGKTLVVGGSYVALECAGFLHAFGCDTTVMVRSIALRGFDRQMAEMVTEHMEKEKKIKFIYGAEPIEVIQGDSGKYRVKWKKEKNPGEMSDLFDTVLFAIGRDPCTLELNLSAANVSVDPNTKKILSGSNSKTVDMEKTSAPNIYAIGDVLQGGVELTPVAIKAGKLLARRLFHKETAQMNYDLIATTVFTPLEYACVGMTEEEASCKLGENNVEVYHCYFKPLEIVAMGQQQSCYMKMICDINKSEKVVGLHILGLNAGEILQGFAAAIKHGITYSQICLNTIGIHPTSAEEVVKLHITKRSNIDPHLTGC